MTDAERYSALTSRELSLSAHVEADELSAAVKKLSITPEALRINSLSSKKALLLKLGEEFGVIGRSYSNSDFQLSFFFSNTNLKESVQHQERHYYRFAQMLSCFNAVIDNAIGIEVHNRNEFGYKPDPSLKNIYVLASAFVDGDTIIPVKLEVKEFFDKKTPSMWR